MIGLTRFEKAYYELSAELALYKAVGNEYQELMASIMEYRHPSDFLRSTPWGRWGDRKCDGYLQSRKRIYAVYAPFEMKDGNEAIRKVRDDYEGAVAHWKEHCDEWYFVHNSKGRGLGPHMIELIQELRDREDGVNVEILDMNGLLNEILLLPAYALQNLFGHVPTERDMLAVEFVDINHVLEYITDIDALPLPDLSIPPADKMKRNALSDEVEDLLKMGMRKSGRVREFFAKYHDPHYGDRIATTFKHKYLDLKKQITDPDEIFRELWLFAGKSGENSPRQEMAILSIIAHLFETCDIFERE